MWYEQVSMIISGEMIISECFREKKIIGLWFDDAIEIQMNEKEIRYTFAIQIFQKGIILNEQNKKPLNVWI